jgi:hypothetical protein
MQQLQSGTQTWQSKSKELRKFSDVNSPSIEVCGADVLYLQQMANGRHVAAE